MLVAGAVVPACAYAQNASLDWQLAVGEIVANCSGPLSTKLDDRVSDASTVARIATASCFSRISTAARMVLVFPGHDREEASTVMKNAVEVATTKLVLLRRATLK